MAATDQQPTGGHMREKGHGIFKHDNAPARARAYMDMPSKQPTEAQERPQGATAAKGGQVSTHGSGHAQGGHRQPQRAARRPQTGKGVTEGNTHATVTP